MMPGSSVRIASRCLHNARTGVVTETPLFWAMLGWHRVELDPAPPYPTWGIFPATELHAAARPQPAQASLWGGL